MRINKFVASASGLSRRKADEMIGAGKVTVNGKLPDHGQDITQNDVVQLGSRTLTLPETITIMLNKPLGYVVSREGQGSRTIYELLPSEYQRLKPVGRLDKDSSGLLLLTNDGDLAQQLTHPSKQKLKIYQVSLNKPLTPSDQARVEQGVELDDGLSKLQIRSKKQGSGEYEIMMREGRNRQIRRTFAALGYIVKTLHRTQFGNYRLGQLATGDFQNLPHDLEAVE